MFVLIPSTVGPAAHVALPLGHTVFLACLKLRARLRETSHEERDNTSREKLSNEVSVTLVAAATSTQASLHVSYDLISGG